MRILFCALALLCAAVGFAGQTQNINDLRMLDSLNRIRLRQNADGILKGYNASGTEVFSIDTATGVLTGVGSGLTSLPAGNLTGTLPDARFPATLPAVSGVNLTNLAPENFKSGRWSVPSIYQNVELAGTTSTVAGLSAFNAIYPYSGLIDLHPATISYFDSGPGTTVTQEQQYSLRVFGALSGEMTAGLSHSGMYFGPNLVTGASAAYPYARYTVNDLRQASSANVYATITPNYIKVRGTSSGVTDTFGTGLGNDGVIIADDIASNRDVHAQRNMYAVNAMVVGANRTQSIANGGLQIGTVGTGTGPIPYFTTADLRTYDDGLHIESALLGYKSNVLGTHMDIMSSATLATSGTITSGGGFVGDGSALTNLPTREQLLGQEYSQPDTASTSEATLSTLATLSANSLTAGKRYRVKYMAHSINGTTSAQSTTLLIYLGAVQLNVVSFSADDYAGTGGFQQDLSGSFEFVCKTTGVSGTVFSAGEAKQTNLGADPTSGGLFVVNGVSPSIATVNTTTSNAVIFKGYVADAGQSLVLDSCTLEQLN
jgi:hypothetical protein